MKSYIQGMITGGVMVFATIVLMGTSEYFGLEGESGTYIPYAKNQILDTRNGTIYSRQVSTGKIAWEVWSGNGLDVRESRKQIDKAITANEVFESVPLELYRKK